MRLTQKLLSFLNRVFDKDPGRFLALRLRYDGAMTWRVEDGVLTTTVTGGSGQDLTVDLTQYRIADLIVHLAAQPGYEIAYGDQTELSLLSARVLLDASGDINKSNGDHLYGYTSLLWAYLEAQASELKRASDQIPEALAQMSTKTAEGEWLDELGSYYAVPRIQGENDASYGPRIIAEVLRPRGNNVAMEAAIKIFTGQDSKVTDVTLWGPTFPLYDGAILYDGTWPHEASAQPLYGLFDVQYGYDFINGGDITQFHEIVRGLVGRLRDAGTHLRSLQLRGSDMSDDFTFPPTDPDPISWQAGAALEDTLDAPTDPQFEMSSALSEFSDDDTVREEGVGLIVSYRYRYEGVRRYDGTIYHLGGDDVSENVGTPGDIAFDAGNYPTLDLEFFRGGPLDPRITFSRPDERWEIVDGVLTRFGPNELVLIPGVGLSLRPNEQNLIWPWLPGPGTWGTGNVAWGDTIEAAGYTLRRVNANAAGSGVGKGLSRNGVMTIGAGETAMLAAVALPQPGKSYFHLSFSNYVTWEGNLGASVEFDLQAGTSSWQNGVPAVAKGMIPLADGAWLCWIVGRKKTDTADTTLNPFISCWPTVGTTAGNEHLYVGGVQVAKNVSTLIPPIPTTTGAVTRSRDEVFIDGADFNDLLRGSEGAVILDIEDEQAAMSGVLRIMSEQSTWLQVFRYVNPLDGIHCFTQDARGVPSRPMSDAPIPGTIQRANRIGFKWKDDAMKAFANAALGRTGGVAQGTPNRLDFLYGTGIGPMIIKRMLTFKDAPSDAQMAAMTRP